MVTRTRYSTPLILAGDSALGVGRVGYHAGRQALLADQLIEVAAGDDLEFAGVLQRVHELGVHGLGRPRHLGPLPALVELLLQRLHDFTAPIPIRIFPCGTS